MLIGIEWTLKEPGIKVTNPQALAVQDEYGSYYRLPEIVFAASYEVSEFDYFPVITAYVGDRQVLRRAYREMESATDALEFAVNEIESVIGGIDEEDYYTCWTLKSWSNEIKKTLDKLEKA